MKRILLVLGFICGLIIYQRAYADGGATQELSDQLVNILGVALGGVFLTLINRAIDAFENRTGVEVKAQQRQFVNSIVDMGISFAEEQTHKAIKNKIAKSSLPAKLDVATGFILDIIKNSSAADLTKEQVQMMIEARLGTIRNGKAHVLSLLPSLPSSSPSGSSTPTSSPSGENSDNPWKGPEAQATTTEEKK